MQARNAHVCLRSGRALMALVPLLAAGCLERPLVPIPPCTRSRVAETIEVTGVEDVDLLLVVDDSNSMAEEQGQLIAQLPRLVEVLASGDRGLDGTIDFRAARSLHVGIVSSDMGVGVASGVGLEGCSMGNGDDGVLFASGPSCPGASGPVFEFERGGDASAFARDVGCAANLGTLGCGYEQPLESMLKALSPAGPEPWAASGYLTPAFLSGGGQGGSTGLNTGFIRDGSVLAIIMVTDENDCSASDSSIFELDDPRYASAIPNLRCWALADRLHAASRYVDGLVALRTRPSRVVFGAITGVPVSAVTDGLSYDEMLALPEMQEQPDALRPSQLSIACRGPLQEVGAFPGRRLVEVARGLQQLGAATTVQSICQGNFEGALDRIIDELATVLGGACLPHPLNPDAEGRVACEVHEVLPAIETSSPDRSRCASLPSPDAYTRVGEETEVVRGVTLHHEICAVRSLGRSDVGAVPGWFYDDASAPGSTVRDSCGSATEPGQRISFSMLDAIPGAELRLVCDQTIAPGDGAATGIGSFCDPDAPRDACAEARAPDRVSPLACDRLFRTCALACTDSSICSGAGLGGQVCDPRTAGEIFGDHVPPSVDEATVHGFCVNPICDE